MHELLRQELGIDAFALDGSETVVAESWQDRPRPHADREPVRIEVPAAS